MINRIISSSMRDEAPTRVQPSISASGNGSASCPPEAVSPVTEMVVCCVDGGFDCVLNVGKAAWIQNTPDRVS